MSAITITGLLKTSLNNKESFRKLYEMFKTRSINNNVSLFTDLIDYLCYNEEEDILVQICLSEFYISFSQNTPGNNVWINFILTKLFYNSLRNVIDQVYTQSSYRLPNGVDLACNDLDTLQVVFKHTPKRSIQQYAFHYVKNCVLYNKSDCLNFILKNLNVSKFNTFELDILFKIVFLKDDVECLQCLLVTFDKFNMNYCLEYLYEFGHHKTLHQIWNTFGPLLDKQIIFHCVFFKHCGSLTAFKLFYSQIKDLVYPQNASIMSQLARHISKIDLASQFWIDILHKFSIYLDPMFFALYQQTIKNNKKSLTAS
ncbi:MAG TPA: hypothetical protein DCP55_07800 [Chitinophagaceae bacterium]|nr:hypothetical protein [Chitinophagaceae bacterium]